MSLIRVNKIKKYYGDRLILDIKKFEVFDGDRIGIVGKNGVGKSTLLKIIIGEEEVDEGQVYLTDSYSYISQLDINREIECNIENNIFKGPIRYKDYLSGGEKVRLKIKAAIGKDKKLILADEPTANLDKDGIEDFIKLINKHSGSLVIVSHDRDVLDSLCNIIVEIVDCKLNIYKGNYSVYSELKNENIKRKELEYNKYISEKERLEKAILVKEKKRDSIKAVPTRMGNSEARLHRKMGDQRGKKNLDGNIKALKSRIDHLEVKECPKKESEIKIDVVKTLEIKSKFVISAKNINVVRGNKTLIFDGSFNIRNGDKVALLGVNGSGKTSLLKDIISRSNRKITLSQKAVIGYFEQELNILDDNLSVIENIKMSSAMDESFIRINLARFGFYRDDVLKKINDLSGGERVKVALCKVLLSDNNVLILDEPTNYLDIKAMEALEKALIKTNKTILIVSHDRRLIDNVCNSYIEIKNRKVSQYYDKSGEKYEKQDDSIVLKNRLVEIISLLSYERNLDKKNELEKEYYDLLKKLKQ